MGFFRDIDDKNVSLCNKDSSYSLHLCLRCNYFCKVYQTKTYINMYDRLLSVCHCTRSIQHNYIYFGKLIPISSFVNYLRILSNILIDVDLPCELWLCIINKL